jgi:hypothetical protein
VAFATVVDMCLSNAHRREEVNIRSRRREEKEKEQETREERVTEATVETKDMGKERAGESRRISMGEKERECRHLTHGPARSFGEVKEERMQARHQRHHGCNSRLGFIAWEIGATAHRGGKHMGSLEE